MPSKKPAKAKTGKSAPAPRSARRITARRHPETDKRKQSIYIPEDLLDEIREESTRQERSLSWMIQTAWKLARDEIRATFTLPA